MCMLLPIANSQTLLSKLARWPFSRHRQIFHGQPLALSPASPSFDIGRSALASDFLHAQTASLIDRRTQIQEPHASKPLPHRSDHPSHRRGH